MSQALDIHGELIDPNAQPKAQAPKRSLIAAMASAYEMEPRVFLDTIKAEQVDGNEAREIVLRPGTDKEKRLNTQTYLLHYSLPQFFFHVTTTYDLLRHNGVEVGKRDYMGAY